MLRDPDLYTMLVILPDRSSHILPPDTISIEELLVKYGCKPTSVIVIKNGTIVPEDFVAEGNDEIKIISVSHGG